MDFDLKMTEEMRAELTSRRQTAYEAKALAELKKLMFSSDQVLLPRTHDFSVAAHILVPFDTPKTRSKAKKLKGPFRHKVAAAIDTLEERALALAELGVEAGLFRTFRVYGGDVRVGLVSDWDQNSLTVARAAEKLFGGLAELEERIELELLRDRNDSGRSWALRRKARKAAAVQLIAELELFLDALSGFDELESVELTANEILAAQEAAADEVEALAQTS